MRQPLSSSGSVLLLSVFIAVLVNGCTGSRQGDSGPTPLLAGVPSRIGPDDARRLFGAGDRWRVLDEWSREKNDPRPAARIVRVWIEPYSDLGVDGALMLKFFNEELASATFFPGDMEGYIESLREKRGLDLSSQSTIRLPPGTGVVRGVNATKEPYVTWEDITTAEKLRRATS